MKMKTKGFFLLLLITLSECGTVADTTQSLVAAPVKLMPDAETFSEEQRTVVQKMIMFTMGMLNVLWMGFWIVANTIVDNKWAGPSLLRFLQLYVIPAINGKIQLKVIMFMNGLLALTRGVIVFFRALKWAIALFAIGMILETGFYYAYVKGTKKVLKAQLAAEKKQAGIAAKAETRANRMARVSDVLRMYRDYEIAKPEGKEAILDAMLEAWALTKTQYREVKELGSEEERVEYLRETERRNSEYYRQDAAGEVGVEGTFCCDLGSKQDGAVVRFQNNPRDLHTELERLMEDSPNNPFHKVMAEDDELRDVFEHGILPLDTLNEMLLNYHRDQRTRTGICGTTEAECAPLLEYVVQRFQYKESHIPHECCKRSVKVGTQAKCTWLQPGIKLPYWFEDGSTSCGPYCDLPVATLIHHCDSLYSAKATAESRWVSLLPILFIGAAMGIVVLMVHSSSQWDVFKAALGQEPDTEVNPGPAVNATATS